MVIGLVIFIIGVGGWIVSSNNRQTPPVKSNKLQVVASCYPLYYFAKEIGGAYVEVYNITPAGAEPHDYEPTTQDVARMERSQLLIINGGGFEPWADKIKSTLDGTHLSIISVGEQLMTSTIKEGGTPQKDPHVWLDPVLAKQQVIVIASALKLSDSKHASAFDANVDRLLSQLDKLDGEFRGGLQTCQQRTIITSHSAFGYVAREYGFEQVSIAGLSPDEEPTPQKLAELTRFAKTNSIRYIFFETLVSPKLAQTLAHEVGAQTLVFNPLEGLTPEEVAQGVDYFSVQRENLKQLKIALGCR